MIQVVDLFDRWDSNGDRQFRKREFLVAMKLMVGDEERWRAHTRAAVDEIYDRFRKNKRGKVSHAGTSGCFPAVGMLLTGVGML